MGENYGRTESKKPEKVMVEFVSANPTGPMHMGNARGGVLGDCLSSVLDWSGNDVTREFYINDAGNQVDKFAHSVEGRYIQEIRGEDAIEFDASWYQGDDIKALAHDLVEQYGDSLLEKTPEERFAVIEGYGLPTNIARMERDLKRYKINYDVWFRESTLHESGYVKETIDMLTAKGATYETEDGALCSVRPTSAATRTTFCAVQTVFIPTLRPISLTIATSSRSAALTVLSTSGALTITAM